MKGATFVYGAECLLTSKDSQSLGFHIIIRCVGKDCYSVLYKSLATSGTGLLGNHNCNRHGCDQFPSRFYRDGKYPSRYKWKVLSVQSCSSPGSGGLTCPKLLGPLDLIQCKHIYDAGGVAQLLVVTATLTVIAIAAHAYTSF